MTHASLANPISLVRTTLVRRGNALPSDSNVFLPITIGFPIVISLKYFPSTGFPHGMALLLPIRKFLSIAAIIEIIASVYSVRIKKSAWRRTCGYTAIGALIGG